MANRSKPRPENPLDAYLKSIDSPFDSLLAYEATEVSKERFRIPVLRQYVRERLQAVKYPHPAGLDPKKTFYEVLQNANALPLLMSRDSLTEIWKCFLVSDVFDGLELRRKTGMFPSGQIIRFHSQMRSEIRRHLKAVTKLAHDYFADDPTAKYRAALQRELNRQERWILLNRNRGHKRSLLRAATYGTTRKDARDVKLATQIAIFRFLKWLLSNRSTRKNGITDLFLRSLARLLAAPSSLKVIDPNAPEAENLRKAIQRLNLQPPGTLREISSPKNT